MGPAHPFEAIQTPMSVIQFPDGGDNVRAHQGRPVMTVVEINLEDESEVESGLDDAQVAWWLTDEKHLANFDNIAAQDPPWCCPICSEGIEAEHCHGCVVRICNDAIDGANATAAGDH